MARIARVVFGGALLLLLALLWREHCQVNDLQARLAETETRLARAAAASRKLPLPRAESAIAEPALPRSTAPAPVTVAAPGRALSESERGFRKGMDEQRRWRALAKHADLLATLNLPSQQAAALKELLVERDYVERDARDAARVAGLSPDQAAASEVAKVDARIRGLLGEVDYARYAGQIARRVFRDQLDTSPIPGSMVDAGVPLTAEQKTWIAETMQRAFTVQAGNPPAASSDPDAARRAFATTLLAEAPGRLTPAQIAALRDYFRKDDELAGHMNTMIRERAVRP